MVGGWKAWAITGVQENKTDLAEIRITGVSKGESVKVGRLSRNILDDALGA